MMNFTQVGQRQCGTPKTVYHRPIGSAMTSQEVVDCIFPMCSGCLNRFRWWLSTRLPLYMMKLMEIWPFSKPFRSLAVFGHKNSNWFPPFWDWNPPPFWNVPQASYILYLFWQLAGGAKQFSQVPLISRSELLKSLQCLDENLGKNGWWRYHGTEGDTYYITYIYIICTYHTYIHRYGHNYL